MANVKMDELVRVQTIGADGIGVYPPVPVEEVDKVSDAGLEMARIQRSAHVLPHPGAVDDGAVMMEKDDSWGSNGATLPDPSLSADNMVLAVEDGKFVIADPSVNTDVVQYLAPPYSTDTTYSKGECVIYDGDLYKAKQDIDTAEAWTADHWEQTRALDEITAKADETEVSELKTALTQEYVLITQSDLYRGTWENGAKTSWDKRLCNKTLYPVKKGDKVIYDVGTLNLFFAVYPDGETTAVGGSGWITTSGTAEYIVPADGGLFFNVKNSGGTSIAITDYDCTVKICTTLTGRILSLYGLPLADYDENNLVFIKTLTLSQKSSTISNVNLNVGLYVIDTTSMTENTCFMYFSETSSFSNPFNTMLFLKGEKRLVYLAEPTAYMYASLSAYSNTQTISIYRVQDGEAENLLNKYNLCIPVSRRTISVSKWMSGQYGSSGKGTSLTNICTNLFRLNGTFRISLSSYSTYKFGVYVYDQSTGDYDNGFDSGWRTSDLTIKIMGNKAFGISVAHVDGTAVSLSEVDTIGLNISFDDSYYPVLADKAEVERIDAELSVVKNIADYISPFKFKAFGDHLFVNRMTDAVIPHESLYHVRVSRLMGFNAIEANVHKTSDNVYIVNHLESGKFGRYFHHVDGNTDISNTAVSSVTWSWIVENVRYNSTVKKYQTRPCRLEEFLSECRQQNIIPFIDSDEAAVVALANKYMGRNNYIAYGATRANCPDSIIYVWSSLTTKEEILALCNSYGRPFIYGMANPSSFTDEQLKEIVALLHENGYWIGTSYQDNNWYKYSYLGFDLNTAQRSINRLDNGNVCDINSIFGFGSFTFTSATETDGVLTYSGNGTLVPSFTAETLSVGGIDLEIVFNGEITVPAIGERLQTTFTSDGSYPVFVTTPIINGSPALSITVSSGTVVYDCKYKVSKF